MPERPKQASYASRYEVRGNATSNSSKPAQKPPPSSSQPHSSPRSVSKRPPAQITSSTGQEGKMVRYMNIDDIPDGFSGVKAVPEASNEDHSATAQPKQTPVDKMGDNYRTNQTYTSKDVERRSSDWSDDESESLISSIADNKYSESQIRDQRPSYSHDKQIADINDIKYKDLPPLPSELTSATIERNPHIAKQSIRVPSSSSAQNRDSKSNVEQKLRDIILSEQFQIPNDQSGSPSYYPTSPRKPTLPAFPAESNYAPTQLPYSVPLDDPQAEKSKLFFSREPRKVEFKPYSLQQYRMIKPKEYVEIAKIKPDLNTDELIAKRANLQRVKEFARNLKLYNDSTIVQQPKLPAASEQQEIQKSKLLVTSKRSKALEFAKNIAKPVVRFKDSEEATGADDGGAHQPKEQGLYGITNEEEQRIYEMELKHLEKKKQIDAIKKSLGLK